MCESLSLSVRTPLNSSAGNFFGSKWKPLRFVFCQWYCRSRARALCTNFSASVGHRFQSAISSLSPVVSVKEADSPQITLPTRQSGWGGFLRSVRRNGVAGKGKGGSASAALIFFRGAFLASFVPK